MTRGEHVVIGRGAALAAAAALLLGGVGGAYLMMRAGQPDGGGTPSSPPVAEVPMPPQGPATPLAAVLVPLSPEAAERAGVVVVPVSSETASDVIRLPGVVEPNAYRQVVVTPLVAGRVTTMVAELGDRVRRGQALAEIYSPALAEAQTRYVAARAMLEAHDQELQRTERLAAIGASSRQELERIHAEHAAQTAEVQSARSTLELLGVPAAALDELAAGGDVAVTMSVAAPAEGVITERQANVGLNVDPATKLVTIVDLSTVWVVADVYERDFARVRVGQAVAITMTAYPERRLEGRISYIDPQVNPDTRTARLRVEVANPRQDLRLGMYAEVLVSTGQGAPVPVVPRSAVQNVGDRTVVYVANPEAPGSFTEREVQLGEASGEGVVVVSGVRPGERVVAQGSFSLRAERERLGLRSVPRPQEATQSREAGKAGNVQAVRIILDEQGYQPPRVALRAGTPARITFLRTTDKTCGTELVFPSLNVKRALPLNQPVVIEFTPEKAGEIAFACGMNMLKGTIVVE